MDFETLLRSEGPLVADGGMGTMLFSLGLDDGTAPMLWNVEQPDKVRQIHRAYIEAGAQIILTNTFGGNRFRLGGHGLADRVAELNAAGAKLARQEADAASHPVIVAGSMGPTGEFFEPLGPLTPELAVETFAEQAAALVANGVDVFWVETMSDLEEVRAAVAGCRKASPSTPVVATLTFDTKGRTMMGVTPEKAAAALIDLDVSAFGANCGNGPREIESVIAKLRAASPDACLVAKANAGLPHLDHGVTRYDAGPEDMAIYARQVRDNGARIIGACCGSTPAHVAAIAGALRETV